MLPCWRVQADMTVSCYSSISHIQICWMPNNFNLALTPWSRHLAPGVFKLLHPFHSFLTSSFCLPALSTIFHSKHSPRYFRFQLPSYNLFLPNLPFSCIYLQHSSSLHSSCSLRSPSDPACLLCTASRVGGGWDPGGWGPPWGPTHFFGPDICSRKFVHLENLHFTLYECLFAKK